MQRRGAHVEELIANIPPCYDIRCSAYGNQRFALPDFLFVRNAFQTITTTLATYMRQREDRAKEGEDGALRWKEAVSWYCHQHQDDLASEEDLSNMQKLVNQVKV